jgi:hypothetical protein
MQTDFADLKVLTFRATNIQRGQNNKMAAYDICHYLMLLAQEINYRLKILEATKR